MTEEGRRIRKAINWLIFQEVVDSETDLAMRLGYKKASLSQIINGKVPVSEKFVRKLCSLDENINFVWIMKGEGTLLKQNPTDNPITQQDITIPQAVWAVIQSQAQSLATKDRQIDDLIKALNTQIEESKKTAVRREEDVASAAAV